LVGVGLLLLLAAVVAGWMRMQLLDTPTWRATSEQALQEPAVRTAIGRTTVDRLFERSDVETRVAAALPPRAQGLSGPATAQLREAAYRLADRALESQALNEAWLNANEAGHEAVVDIVRGDSTVVTSTGDQVTLDLRPLIALIAARVGFGGRATQIIPNRYTVVHPRNAQNVARSIETLRLLDRASPILTLLAAACIVASIAIATGNRRHVIAWWAGGAIVVGFILHSMRTIGGNYIVDALTAAPDWQVAMHKIYAISTNLLRLTSNALILVGALALAGLWLVAANRPAAVVRRRVAPALRWSALASWLGAAVVVYIALTQIPALDASPPLATTILLLIAAAGFAALRYEVLRLTSAPASHAPVVHEPASLPATAAATPSELDARLARLSDLHDRGVVDDEEYEAAIRLAQRSVGGSPVPAPPAER
jgi:hypothetical protein